MGESLRTHWKWTDAARQLLIINLARDWTAIHRGRNMTLRNTAMRTRIAVARAARGAYGVELRKALL